MRQRFIITLTLLILAICPPQLHAAETLQKKAETALLHAHISKITWQGKTLWIKGVAPYKKALWYCYKKKLGKWLAPKPLFTPTVACGREMLAIEKEQLILFKQRGARVPSLISSAENWLALENLGTNLEINLRQTTPEQRDVLLLQALDALIDLHQKGLAHGRARVRNMVLTHDGHIGFIDLAEDPLRYMTLAQAQARDFLLFIFSAIPFIKQEYATQQKLITHSMEQTSPEVKQAIHETFLYLKLPYNLTYYFYHFLKADGQRALDVYTALEAYYANEENNAKMRVIR